MTAKTRIALVAGLLAAAASSAHATTVNFEFLNGAVDVADGSFSYNGGSGVLGYGDLTSFSITVAGQTYDLAFALASTNYAYFAYDTSGQSFVAGTGDGTFGPQQELLGAFDGGPSQDPSKGYFFAPDGNYSELVSNTFGQTFDTTTITTDDVPEPASLAVFAVALTGLGIQRRRRQTA